MFNKSVVEDESISKEHIMAAYKLGKEKRKINERMEVGKWKSIGSSPKHFEIYFTNSSVEKSSPSLISNEELIGRGNSSIAETYLFKLSRESILRAFEDKDSKGSGIESLISWTKLLILPLGLSP